MYTVYTVYCVTLYVRCTMLMHAMSQSWCNVYAVYTVYCVTYVRCTMLMHTMSQGWCNVYAVYTVYCVTLYVRCTMLMHAMSQSWCNVYTVYCVTLSTRAQQREKKRKKAQIWTSDVLLWLFFATCAPMTVPLIHRVPFLKLSRV